MAAERRTAEHQKRVSHGVPESATGPSTDYSGGVLKRRRCSTPMEEFSVQGAKKQ